MSTEAMNFVDSLEDGNGPGQVPYRSRGILNAIASFMHHSKRSDHHGLCWAGLEKIARKAGRSDRTARRHIRLLQATGVLVKVTRRHRGHGRGGATNCYLILGYSDQAANVPANRDSASGQGQTIKRTLCPKQADIVSDNKPKQTNKPIQPGALAANRFRHKVRFGDHSWKNWMNAMSEQQRDEALLVGEIDTTQIWPCTNGAELLAIGKRRCSLKPRSISQAPRWSSANDDAHVRSSIEKLVVVFIAWLIHHELTEQRSEDDFWYLAKNDFAVATDNVLPERSEFFRAIQRVDGIETSRLPTAASPNLRCSTFYRFSNVPKSPKT